MSKFKEVRNNHELIAKVQNIFLLLKQATIQCHKTYICEVSSFSYTHIQDWNKRDSLYSGLILILNVCTLAGINLKGRCLLKRRGSSPELMCEIYPNIYN